jgi:hypothetical protein
LDNGLTAQSPAVEQYSYNMAEWGLTIDVDLIGELATIANQFRAFARTLGVNAAQTRERIAKNRIFAAYNGGNTFVRGDISSNTTSVVYVDDIRGFQTVYVNGVSTPISGTNPLTVTEFPTGPSGVTQTFTITAATATGTNVSVYPSDVPGIQGSAGTSGYLTISPPAANAPNAGDGLVAANAATVLRPNGKTATTQLNIGDVLTLGLCLDGVTILRNNAVPNYPDGGYRLIVDNVGMRQLFADQQFLIAYAARYNSTEYQSGQIFQLLGITFIPTNEAYYQIATPTSGIGINVPVRRPVLMGAESLLEGNFEGLRYYNLREGYDPISVSYLVDNILLILRPPLDRMGRNASLTYTWIGDYAIPTDVTTTPAIIPTASNATYKRVVVFETAG